MSAVPTWPVLGRPVRFRRGVFAARPLAALGDLLVAVGRPVGLAADTEALIPEGCQRADGVTWVADWLQRQIVTSAARARLVNEARALVELERAQAAALVGGGYGPQI